MNRSPVLDIYFEATSVLQQPKDFQHLTSEYLNTVASEGSRLDWAAQNPNVSPGLRSRA